MMPSLFFTWLEVVVLLMYKLCCARALAFLIVTVVIIKELLKGLPWKFLHTDDLISMAETEAFLCEKIARSKLVMQTKDPKMNSGRRK